MALSLQSATYFVIFSLLLAQLPIFVMIPVLLPFSVPAFALTAATLITHCFGAIFLILIYVLSVLALLKPANIFSLLALLMTLLVTHASMPLMVLAAPFLLLFLLVIWCLFVHLTAPSLSTSLQLI